MKIKKITIKNYKQFSNLELDLTYPTGHLKAGKPLDKICIIGQSGTGKSNLLEVIRNQYNSDEVITNFIHDKLSKSEKIYFADTNRIASYLGNDSLTDTDQTVLEELAEYRKKIEQQGMNFHGLDEFSKKIQEIDTNIIKLKSKYVAKELDKSKNFINIDENAWKLLENKISNYDNERLGYIDTLSNKLLNLEGYEKQDFILEKQKWDYENENIVDKISDKLNSILIKFNLKLTKIDRNQKDYNDLTIKDLSNDNIIKYDNLSTGTKNLLSTFIPLKIYNPKDSIILIDEPENSFYPDIQRVLTELYKEIGKNNQLIFATHSPLIASSFEPWEIVELKFNDNNQVYKELYFKGENHIENYFLDPRMLTWTSILTDIFDLKVDSNFTFREEKLMEYAMLKAEIKAIQKGEERDEKVKKFKKLSMLLGLKN